MDTAQRRQAMIRAVGLTKRYADGAGPVLDGLALSVEAGEWLAVVGASGAGKSTLLSILAGLDRRYSGEVEVGGAALQGMTDTALARVRLKQIGMVFQSFHLIGDLSARDNVALAGHFGDSVPRAEALRRADALLERFGLSPRARSPPSKLSGGERQRVAMARALFNDPDVLLCDEPTGNLDVENGRKLTALLTELRQQGKCIVSVTHEAQLSAAADRVLELRAGKLVAPGAPA